MRHPAITSLGRRVRPAWVCRFRFTDPLPPRVQHWLLLVDGIGPSTTITKDDYITYFSCCSRILLPEERVDTMALEVRSVR